MAETPLVDPEESPVGRRNLDRTNAPALDPINNQAVITQILQSVLAELQPTLEQLRRATIAPVTGNYSSLYPDGKPPSPSKATPASQYAAPQPSIAELAEVNDEETKFLNFRALPLDVRTRLNQKQDSNYVQCSSEFTRYCNNLTLNRQLEHGILCFSL